MISCKACQKVYSTPYNLNKHWKRQPMCKSWISLEPGLKDFVDHKIELQADCQQDNQEPNTTCMTCNTVFANVGNLNRHLLNSVICNKWDVYNELEPIQGYLGRAYSEFDAPEHYLHHIMRNVYLIDKEFTTRRDLKQILEENNVKYAVSILPHELGRNAYFECDYQNMPYVGHDMNIDIEQFDKQCENIEEYRARGENVVVYCNNGYQRSVAFLTYYLVKHHNDRVTSIENAIDIILPIVDAHNYSHIRSYRSFYLDRMNALFAGHMAMQTQTSALVPISTFNI